MASLFIGLFIIALSLVYSLKNANSTTFLQVHALVIVGGGTLGILFLLSPTESLRSLYDSIAALFKPTPKISDLKNDLIMISQRKPLSTPSKSPLIHYISELYSQGVDANLFNELVIQKAGEIEARAVDSIQTLKNLAKYPPALGMVGTVVGMIGLFAEIESAKESIGSHLAVAMTATFYGLLLSNMILGPLADRMEISLSRSARIHQTILDIVLLISQKEPQSIIEDELNAKIA